MPSLAQRGLDRGGRLVLQRGVRAGDDAVRADLGEPGEAELLGLGPAHDDDRGGAVGDLRRRARGDRAVLAERRACSRARLSTVVSARMPSSSLNSDRVALALRDRDRHDLVVEEPVLPALRRRAGGERAANASCSSRREVAGRPGCAASVELAHRLVGEGVPQAVVRMWSTQRHVAVLVALRATRAAGAAPAIIDSCRRPPRCRTRRRRISWSASAIASSPERQTLLIVSAGTVIGMPAATAAWRAGIWPGTGRAAPGP